MKLEARRKMSISTVVLSLSLMMILVGGSVDMSFLDASALKGQGVPTRSIGSASDVCGDKLCSEVKDSMKKASSNAMKDNNSVSMKQVTDKETLETANQKSAMMDKMMSDVAVKTQTKELEGVGLEFKIPDTIYAKSLVPINARVFDLTQGANLSHTDWSYAVIDSTGKIVHKSTTLHGHFGVMNFKDSFPSAGSYSVQYTVLSSGPFMLGAPVPELGQTRSVITGDLLRFEEDPKTNFGSRTFEFTVNVMEPQQSVVVEGSELGTAYLIKLTTIPAKVVAGQPVTLIFDVDDYHTGEDATHVDALISVIPQHYYQSDSGDQPDIPVPIPLHGAYHGHLGSFSLTQTFEKSGTVLLEADLSSVPYSIPPFGQGSIDFTIQVFDSENISDSGVASMEKPKNNVVDIVGLSSPFYMPNTVKVFAGEKLIFDNIDGNHHTVTSVKSGTLEHDGKFDSGLLAAGEKYELILDDKGTYDYFCALHVGMIGTIIVE